MDNGLDLARAKRDRACVARSEVWEPWSGIWSFVQRSQNQAMRRVSRQPPTKTKFARLSSRVILRVQTKKRHFKVLDRQKVDSKYRMNLVPHHQIFMMKNCRCLNGICMVHNTRAAKTLYRWKFLAESEAQAPPVGPFHHHLQLVSPLSRQQSGSNLTAALFSSSARSSEPADFILGKLQVCGNTQHWNARREKRCTEVCVDVEVIADSVRYKSSYYDWCENYKSDSMFPNVTFNQ